MYNRKKILACVLVLMTVGLIGVSAVTPVKAYPKFFLAGWSYPDAYGQGIEGIEVYENSSGAWDQFGIGAYEYDDSESELTLDWTVGVAARINVFTFFNSTLTGVSSRTEGKLYQRHYVIVTDSSDATIFSLQNFTYSYSDETNWPLYFYEYYAVLDFLPISGEIYTITIMYEIYY